MGFSQQSVNDNGGVAWAKQVAETMDPGAIDSQIQSYQAAANSLASVQTTLQNVKNNLAASWTGDAADQAQQSFQQSINHAQQTQDTITSAVIPPLQSAKQAQTDYINSMSKVPSEQSVPSNSFVDDVGSFFGVETPAQKAESHNLAARTQTADALNSLTESYQGSASQLQAVGGPTEGGFTPTSSSGAYELGSVASSSGDGAASSYSQSVGGGSYASRSEYVSTPSGGSVNPGQSPKTNLSGNGTSTLADPTWNPTTGGPNPSPTPVPDPIWNTTGPVGEENGGPYSKAGLITDEPENVGSNGIGGENGLGEDGLNSGGRPRTSSGVFDETGMGDGELNGGTGNGPRGRMSSSDGTALGGESEGAGGAGGMAEGEGSESGMGGSTGRGMGGAGAGEEDLGSSKYTRGRYIGAMEEDEGRSLSPVRSVYESATDADGNKVNMMGSGRRGATPQDDEEDERNKRPSYLKEDEFWNNAQRIVPPVIQ